MSAVFRRPGRGALAFAGLVLTLPLAACSGPSAASSPTSAAITSPATGAPATSAPVTDNPDTRAPVTSASAPEAPVTGTGQTSPGPSGSATAAVPSEPVTASPGSGPTGSTGPATTAPPEATATATTTPAGPPASSPAASTPASPQIDGAGATLVAYYGTGGTDVLGILGRGTPQQAWNAVAAKAKQYDRPGLPAVPAFEFIATVAAASPGRGGLYRNRVPDAMIEKYVKTVRANGGMIFLDIQPGRSDFLTEAKALQKWLEQPDVGLALDPEWRMGPNQIPARTIGSVDASEVNQVSAWLDQIVASRNLPDKLFVVHKFTNSMIRHEDRLADRPHLREVINIDGFGKRKLKLDKYHAFAKGSPWPLGLKLFTKKVNDPDLLQPAEVLAITPRPVIVNYQ